MTGKAATVVGCLRSRLTLKRSILAGAALAVSAGVIAVLLLWPSAQPFGPHYADCTGDAHEQTPAATESVPLFFVAGSHLTAPGMSPTQIERSIISWHLVAQSHAELEVTAPQIVASGQAPSTVLWTPSADLRSNRLVYVQGSALQVGLFGGAGYLVMSDANGADRHVVLNYAFNNPMWSPNGRYIAYIYQGLLFIMSSDGSHQHELASPGDIATITWSPNGECIAASSGHGPSRIAIIGVRTNEYAWLTPPSVEAYYPAWSPTANELAYENASRSLVAEDLSTGRTTLVATCPPASCTQDLWPAWSPDGSLLAFVRSNGGPEQIFIVSARGGSARQVTFGPDQHTSPSW